MHRILSRNGLIVAQKQEHQRVYMRWQYGVPMHLWHLDLIGGADAQLIWR